MTNLLLVFFAELQMVQPVGSNPIRLAGPLNRREIVVTPAAGERRPRSLGLAGRASALWLRSLLRVDVRNLPSGYDKS